MVWRHRLREVLLSLTVLSLVGSVVGFAWMTRQPKHPLFQWLAELPVVGLVVKDLRRPHLEAVLRAERTRGTGGDGRRDAADPGSDPEGRDFEWIGIGAQLYQERTDQRSSQRGAVVTTRLASYEVLQREGNWLQVELVDGRKLWVDRSQLRDPTPPLGEAPLPPGPLRSRSVGAKHLEVALSHLEGEPRALQLAGYPTWTDLPDSPRAAALLAALGRALDSIEQSYEDLYGLDPVDQPRETIVLFERLRSYRNLREATEGLAGLNSSGHTAGGLVALAVADREAWDVEATLVHEITHLLNRRAVGPALPPWLSEGLAAHLSGLGRVAHPELAKRYRTLEKPAGGAEEKRAQEKETEEKETEGKETEGKPAKNGRRILYTGPLASLRVLGEWAAEGRLMELATLTSIDAPAFSSSDDGALLYAQSAFWIDHLLEDEQQRESFQVFLQDVAAGESASGEALREHLDLTWQELDECFLGWLGERLARAKAAGQ